MDKLLFGLGWIAFTTIIFIIFLCFGQVSVPLLLFFMLFFAVGIFVLWLGMKDVFKNIKTDKNGEICYGVIKSIEPDPTSVQVNGNPQYRATVEFFTLTINGTMTLSETIGYKMEKYRVGECVKIKYYENDINIIEGNINIAILPYNIQDSLKGVQAVASIPEGLYTGTENTITINGVTYRRDDNNNNQSTL